MLPSIEDVAREDNEEILAAPREQPIDRKDDDQKDEID
jgi:hypothetical protein